MTHPLHFILYEEIYLVSTSRSPPSDSLALHPTSRSTTSGVFLSRRAAGRLHCRCASVCASVCAQVCAEVWGVRSCAQVIACANACVCIIDLEIFNVSVRSDPRGVIIRIRIFKQVTRVQHHINLCYRVTHFLLNVFKRENVCECLRESRKRLSIGLRWLPRHFCTITSFEALPNCAGPGCSR